MRNNLRLAVIITLAALLGSSCLTTAAVNESSISVQGIGVVKAVPDMAIINVGIKETAQTTKAAQEQVNILVSKVIAIFEANGVEDKHISTFHLTYGADTHWDPDTGDYIETGKLVEQSITCKVVDIMENGQVLTTILDSLAEINGIMLNYVSFDIDDKTDLYTEARELAYKKAEQKARELADLSGLVLGKPMAINEGYQDYWSASNNIYQSNMMSMESTAAFDSGSAVPTGELEITYTVDVNFKAK